MCICFSLREEDSRDGTLDSSTEYIMLDETKGGTYLSFDEIGVFLCRLASNGIYLLFVVIHFCPCFLLPSRFGHSILKRLSRLHCQTKSNVIETIGQHATFCLSFSKLNSFLM